MVASKWSIGDGLARIDQTFKITLFLTTLWCGSNPRIEWLYMGEQACEGI